MVEEQARWWVSPETMLLGDRETLRRAVEFFQWFFRDLQVFRGYYSNMRSPLRLVARALLEQILPARERQEFACLVSLSRDFKERARALPLVFDFPQPDGQLVIANLLVLDAYSANDSWERYRRERHLKTSQDQLLAELIDPFEKEIKLMAGLVAYSGTRGLPFAKREEIITAARGQLPNDFSRPVAWF